ncbi:MAG: hypothetical protein K5756_03105 [Clostridiales bacterium]|nr:hypothetical protein [Clostridiales bacterium]
MKYNVQDHISAEMLRQEVERMNRFGVRLTGSAAHKQFVEYIRGQLQDMGLKVYSDPCFFNRWEAKKASIVLHDVDRTIDIPVSSVFPYSGETPPDGVTGELVLLESQRVTYFKARGKIAVVRVNNLNVLPSKLAFDERRSLPEGLHLPENYSGPVATSFVNFPFLAAAKNVGVKAVICIWQGFPDALAEGQYLPFIMDYQGIPALWVNETAGNTIIEAAENHRHATFTLEAEWEKNCEIESLYCILDGSESGESVIVNTHTDGTNCIEENGPIALLALIRALKDKPLRRKHIFLFVTGHFRLPDFRSPGGGGVQATSRWLADHQSLWNGKRGHLKAVAGLSIEHLGCLDWQPEGKGYAPTGDIALELVYTGNSMMDDIYFSALQDRTRVRTLTLRGHNFLHFGEGQPLFNEHIPEIALVTAPDSLCVISETNEMDKFDETLMLEQIQTFMNCLTMIDDMPAEAIGHCERYSLLRI